MNYKIKILQDTPFDSKNTELSIKDYRLKYHYLLDDCMTADYIVQHLKENKSVWFEVIEENNFEIGDWVWHEKLQRALFVNSNVYVNLPPNCCTIDAVKANPNTYKRYATDNEIEYYKLHNISDTDVLIGEYKCYYFNTIWKELIGVENAVKQYLKLNRQFSENKINTMNLDVRQYTWDCCFNGLKIGCQEFSHQNVLDVANILKIKF